MADAERHGAGHDALWRQGDKPVFSVRRREENLPVSDGTKEKAEGKKEASREAEAGAIEEDERTE